MNGKDYTNVQRSITEVLPYLKEWNEKDVHHIKITGIEK